MINQTLTNKMIDPTLTNPPTRRRVGIKIRRVVFRKRIVIEFESFVERESLSNSNRLSKGSLSISNWKSKRSESKAKAKRSKAKRKLKRSVA